MTRRYDLGRFPFSLDNPQGALSIKISGLIGVVLFLALGIAPLLREQGGFGLDEIWRYLGTDADAILKFLKISAAVMAAGPLFMIAVRRLVFTTLQLDETGIEHYSALAALMNKLVPRSTTFGLTRIPWGSVESIRTDLWTGNAEVFVTTLTAGENVIRLPVGFSGYDKVLSELDVHEPQAVWDNNTRAIIDRHRKGFTLRRTLAVIKNQYLHRFKTLVPSRVERMKLRSLAVREQKNNYREIIEMAEARETGNDS